MDFSVFQQLGVAVALGTLIGLERENRFRRHIYSSFGGIRTFALISLMGAIAYMLSEFSMAFFVAISIGFVVLLITAYVMTTYHSRDRGATSEVAAILVYLIGVLSGTEQYLLATIVALIILIILHFKDPLHTWATHVKHKELVSTIQFIIITFVVLPLLPNQGFGPYEFFNPYVVWLMVVFVSGISFVSYIAMKLFGAKRGIILTGFLSGFISTTALAYSFAEMSKKSKGDVSPYLLGISVSMSALFFRVLLEILVVNGELSKLAAIPLLLMGFAAIALTFYVYYKNKDKKSTEEFDKDSLRMESPFQLKPAVNFAVLFAIVLLITKLVVNMFGEKVLYLASFVGGLVDMDSITISMARLAQTDISLRVATVAIVIAVITNTFAKAGIFFLFGSKKLAYKLLRLFIPITVVGAIGLLFI
ncbi:MAG: MgtC/SapB family protein [bacterium]|nr:MgtC/SapB family protein [bacterium]